MSDSAIALDSIGKTGIAGRDSESTHLGRCLVERIETNAAPELVWQAWTQPRHIEGWFVDRADVSGAIAPGGIITWHYDKLGFSSPMTILRAIENQRIMLTPPRFGRDPQPMEAVIDRDDETGVTGVRIIHSGFGLESAGDDEYEGVRSDWYIEMRVLKHYLENYFGSARTSVLVLRRLNIGYDQVQPYYRDESGLRRWLTTAGSVGREGSECALTLANTQPLTGNVLAITGRDVALSWNEIRGVLAMKIFTFPSIGRMMALHAYSWHLNAEQMAPLENFLHGCADRLVTVVEG